MHQIRRFSEAPGTLLGYTAAVGRPGGVGEMAKKRPPVAWDAFDDAGNRRLSDREIDRVSTAVVDVLRRASAGEVTARLLPPGRDAIASIRGGDGEQAIRIDVPLRGVGRRYRSS